MLLPLLTSTASKTLHRQVYKTVISTLKDANKQKHKSPTLNRTVQTHLFTFVANSPPKTSTLLPNLGTTSRTPPGIWAVRITSEMWRKGIWSDARCVELMKEAACSDTPRVALGGVRFFLGRDKDEEEEDSGEEDNLPDLKKLRHGKEVGKKTKSKERQIAAAHAFIKKVLFPVAKVLELDEADLGVEREKGRRKTDVSEFLSDSSVT
jgi:protein SDA1